MKIFERLLLMILAVAIIAATTIACKNNSDEETDTETETSSAVETTITEETTDRYSEKDDLPEKMNFDKDVTVLIWDSIENEWYAEKMTGEVINDAIYQRNLTVEERMNIRFNFNQIPGDGGDTTRFVNEVKSSVYAGDGVYTFISAYSRNAMMCMAEGLLQDLTEYDQIDLDRTCIARQLLMQQQSGRSCSL
jgi:maltose-binding protein MalE